MVGRTGDREGDEAPRDRESERQPSRRDRLTAALRDNLKRRKTQARGRAQAGSEEDPPDPAQAPAGDRGGG